MTAPDSAAQRPGLFVMVEGEANPLDCDCEYVHCSHPSCRSAAPSRGAIDERQRLYPARKP